VWPNPIIAEGLRPAPRQCSGWDRLAGIGSGDVFFRRELWPVSRSTENFYRADADFPRTEDWAGVGAMRLCA